MRTFRSQLAFHWHENRKRLLYFGAIVLLLDLWVLAGYGVYKPENALALVMNNNFAAISIFILLITYITGANSFPLLMGLGSTRRQYYWSSLTYFAAFSVAISLAQTMLMAALKLLLPHARLPSGQCCHFIRCDVVFAECHLLPASHAVLSGEYLDVPLRHLLGLRVNRHLCF